MAERDQVLPLAPAAHRINVDEDPAGQSTGLKKPRRHGKCVKCCGCFSAVVVILAVVIIILFFTVFKVKDPEIRMNSVKLEGLRQGVDFRNPSIFANVTVVADLSIKNPNVASFRFNNATTSLYYGGVEVGSVVTPAGNARAGRTLDMNASVQVMIDRIISAPSLGRDLDSGRFPVNSFTRLRGRVKILGFIKKSVGVRMNCSITLDLQTMNIQDQDCNRKVSL